VHLGVVWPRVARSRAISISRGSKSDTKVNVLGGERKWRRYQKSPSRFASDLILGRKRRECPNREERKKDEAKEKDQSRRPK